jgi:hypothetical protein
MTNLRFEFRYLRERLRWARQRLTRGYADCDIWGLDHYLAKIIYKRLKVFKAMRRCGVPLAFSEHPEEWERVLGDIICAFRIVLDDPCPISLIELGRKEHGLDLFRKYFEDLWD